MHFLAGLHTHLTCLCHILITRHVVCVADVSTLLRYFFNVTMTSRRHPRLTSLNRIVCRLSSLSLIIENRILQHMHQLPASFCQHHPNHSPSYSSHSTHLSQ